MTPEILHPDHLQASLPVQSETEGDDGLWAPEGDAKAMSPDEYFGHYLLDSSGPDKTVGDHETSSAS